MNPLSLHDEHTWRQARRHLFSSDPILAEAMRRHVPVPPRRSRYSRFALLAHSILSQQISMKAAQTIQRRLDNHLDGRWTAPAILAVDDLSFTQCGVSRQKRNYLRDLARNEVEGRLKLRSIHRKPDEEIIEDLSLVKGVGRWTGEMFLIFVLGRPDVLSVGDLGLQNAAQELYGLKARPRPNVFTRIARPWRPWRSVASWYLWATLGGPAT